MWGGGAVLHGGTKQAWGWQRALCGPHPHPHPSRWNYPPPHLSRRGILVGWGEWSHAGLDFKPLL